MLNDPNIHTRIDPVTGKGLLMEEALLQLVIKSIEQRKFAKTWKPHLVKPLHKKKEKTLVGSFRPVSNLVEVGKVAEYAVAEQS